MFRPNTGVGVLNDFDLACSIHHSSQGSERFGTLPLMASDLFKEEYNHSDVPRLYFHDVESFISVFAWVCIGSAPTTVNGQGDYAPG